MRVAALGTHKGVGLIYLQTVTHARFGKQMAWLSRFALNLGPQLGHVEAKVVGVVGEVGSPHLTQELLVCDNLAGAARQASQEFVFGRSQTDRFPLRCY